MPLDLDLQELKRRVAESPGDASAWLQLAVGYERCGAKADAVETFYRARALGAEAKVCADALEKLGARPSPWTHVSGDSERTFSAPVKGPRRGVVVGRQSSDAGPREASSVVVDADGSLLVVGASGVSRWDGSSLERKIRWAAQPGGPRGVAPLVASGGAILVGHSRRKIVVAKAWPDPDWQSLDLPGGQGLFLAAALGPQLIVGTAESGSSLHVALFDSYFREAAWFVVPAQIPGGTLSWALDRERLAIFIDSSNVAVFGLDGRERFHRPAARPEYLMLAPGERTIWSETRRSDQRTLTRWVQALDAKGDYVWSKNLEHENGRGGWGSGLAFSPDGTIHVISFGQLLRFASDGTENSKQPTDAVVDGGIVVDREGVAYCREIGPTTERLVAVAPDGHVLFRVEEPLRPLAIDSLGRLIAHTPQNALVAIE